MTRTLTLSLVAMMTIGLASPADAQDDPENPDPIRIRYNGRIIPIVPAFEDYAFMLYDACDAMKVPEKRCNAIYPMNGDLGGNAIATTVDGNEVIVYDRELSSEVGYGGAMAIIAHELAHHLCGHLKKKGGPAQELVADRYAGAAMKRANESLADTLGMAVVLGERPSHSHPARADRITALREGWEHPESADCR